jgi:anti-sigma-K factor RskA
MTRLIGDTMLMPGGLADLEAYDALEREQEARAVAERTAADLAELIARENARVADLQALLDIQSGRCARLERELTQAGFYSRDETVPSSRWQALKQAWREPLA